MSAKIEIAGLKELEAKLSNLLEIGGKPSRALDSAGRKAWQRPLDEAKRLAPEGDEGDPHLRDAISITVKRPGSKHFTGPDTVHVSGLKIKVTEKKARRALRKLAKAGGANLQLKNPRRYWHLVEFGTSHSAAKPYLRPAIDGAASSVVETFRDALGKSVDKAIAKQERVNGQDFE